MPYPDHGPDYTYEWVFAIIFILFILGIIGAIAVIAALHAPPT